MYLEAFSTHFSAIEDKRQAAKVTYPLFDVLFVTMCAVIAGAEGWTEIHDFATGHHNWFKKHGILVHGVPVDDTIARTISHIDPEQFNACFVSWMQAVNELSGGELVAIDGKTLRGSYNREDRNSTIHMVNAFASGNRMVLGQVKTAEKSNEITAIPELIRLLDVNGALVSTDAMGCQTQIAEDILEGGGDYLFGVKDNQKSLHGRLKELFSEERSMPCQGLQSEKGHGRVEARAYYVKDAAELGAPGQKWQGLQTVAMVVSYRQVKGKKAQLNYRYYISSADLTEQEFADSIRKHWLVENTLHWVLDVSKREDKCLIYTN
jgi:predicted transposase YbfD/YdcC